MSCAAGTCTAVGHSQNALLAEEWNGITWTIQPTVIPAAGDALSGVSCTAASACSAVGQSGRATLAEDWDGSAWSIQPTPNPTPGGHGDGLEPAVRRVLHGRDWLHRDRILERVAVQQWQAHLQLFPAALLHAQAYDAC